MSNPTTHISQKLDKPLSGLHLLLADDNPINISIAQNFIQKWGAKVDIAEDGIEALNLYKEKQFDLVVMDLHMPRMCGLEASSLIREFEFSNNKMPVPIIAFTADVFIEDHIYKKHGITDKIYKPFEPDVFKQLLTSNSLTKSRLVSKQSISA